MEIGKRLFISTFTVRVDSWMPAGDILVVEGHRVVKVLGRLRYRDSQGFLIAEESWINEAPPTGGVTP
jgi:hypothetical protein